MKNKIKAENLKLLNLYRQKKYLFLNILLHGGGHGVRFFNKYVLCPAGGVNYR